MNFITKWQAIKRILKEDEFFVMTASVDKTHKNVIKYNYEANTQRDMFYAFLKDLANTIGIHEKSN